MTQVRSFCQKLFNILLLGIAGAIGSLFFIMHHHAIDFSVLEHYSSGKPSVVLDDTGEEWARFQLDRREPITLSQMPNHLIQAFIAAEDWNFFHHNGISWKGIARSIIVNVYYGRKAQGASTITQQLVRLLFFDAKKTFSRKIKEQIYALLVEMQFTKEQILQTYLNHVYFGCGIYGVQAASQRFWSKEGNELTIDESALLAAIICSPGRYNPLLNPLSAKKRRNMVLHKMVHLGFITQEVAYQMVKHPISIKQESLPVIAPHLKETLRIFLEGMVGKKLLYSGGLSIQTTLNKKMQKIAQDAFQVECVRLKKELGDDVDGALIMIDRKTGEIKALVGGFDFAISKFNRAFQARRQIGSTFKPLVYTAALQEGMTFADTEIDEPIELVQETKSWSPGNYNKKFNGQVTLAYALSRSNNIVTIKILLRIGIFKAIELAKKCRLKGPFHSYPSLALGCIDSTLKEVVGMFNVFANDGIYVEPYYVKWVKSQWGTKLWKNLPEQERIISTHTSGQVSSVLRLGLQRIQKFFTDRWITCQAISKTGTTNDSRTCWFVGSTPTLTTAVYIGYDNNRPMGKNVYPIGTALPIWLAVNRSIEQVQKEFTYDPCLHEVVINERTGKQANMEHDQEAVSILI